MRIDPGSIAQSDSAFKRRFFLIFFSGYFLLNLFLIFALILIYKTTAKQDMKYLESLYRTKMTINRAILLNTAGNLFSELVILSKSPVIRDFLLSASPEMSEVASVFEVISGGKLLFLRSGDDMELSGMNQTPGRYSLSFHNRPDDASILYPEIAGNGILRITCEVRGDDDLHCGFIVLDHPFVRQVKKYLLDLGNEEEFIFLCYEKENLSFMEEISEEKIDLHNDFIDHWHMKSGARGQFHTALGLYTFTEIIPETDILLREGRIDARECSWIVSSFVSSEILRERKGSLLLSFIWTGSVVLGFMIIGVSFVGFTSLKGGTYIYKVLMDAKTDYLTGLSNRRDFIERMKDETARFSRNRKDFTIVIGDIDHFKKINDLYGHNFGDRVLVHVAEILRSSLRKQDIVGRWGGEEFIILLPETGKKEGRNTAEKLRDALEQSPFNYNQREIQVTMSFGVSVYDRLISMDECIKEADDLLLMAKESGRNRVFSSENIV